MIYKSDQKSNIYMVLVVYLICTSCLSNEAIQKDSSARVKETPNEVAYSMSGILTKKRTILFVSATLVQRMVLSSILPHIARSKLAIITHSCALLRAMPRTMYA